MPPGDHQRVVRWFYGSRWLGLTAVLATATPVLAQTPDGGTPGATSAKPGATSAKPGTASSKPGDTSAKPGDATKPSAASSKPGDTSAKPGDATKPGTGPKPGDTNSSSGNKSGAASAKPGAGPATDPALTDRPPLRLAGPASATPAPAATTPGILPPLRLSGPASAAPPVHLSTTAKVKPAAPPPPPSPTPEPAAAAPTPVLPPPSSYLSSMWNVWPHAWAYVPTLWSAWYQDLAPQSRPITLAERAGTAAPPSSATDPPETPATAPTIIAPPTKLVPPAVDVLPAPRLIRRKRYNLVISGFGILTATWAADRLLANGLSPKPETWLPLVGPWILLGQQSSVPAPSVQTQGLLVVDGLLQAGGLSMALLGFILTTRQYVVTVAPMRSELVPREAP